jgi:replication factor C subunit 2/4
MSNILFVNKYQPSFLNEFQLDSEMLDILTTLVQMNNLNILFIGDIGSGKTSFLNAMIHEYYKSTTTNYNDNILHINNLKEQGINYYRNDVKIFCQTCSTVRGKKKIIVLDDIDFINDQSQQVFRNCIDKYSHNVHFIASCTNPQNVIESIQSRLTIIKIKPLLYNNIETIMEQIIEKENIQIDTDAKKFILTICNNTAKILINYMEKIKLLGEPITLEIANSICTNISFFILEKYTNCIKNGDLNEAIKILYDLYDKGYSVMDILDNYFLFVKHTTLYNETEKYEIIPLICKYITIFHNIHEDEIELALFTNSIIKKIYKM